MFVLQRVEDGIFHFTAFDTKAAIFADVRSNYGLTESEFFEFLEQRMYFERPDLYITVYEGEIPTPEESLGRPSARAAQQRQLAARAKK